MQRASLIGKCSQCGPDSNPGDPWGPGKPPTVSPGPHPGQSLVLSPLFGCLLWEVGPAPFTDGETRAQRRGGLDWDPSSEPCCPCGVALPAGPVEAWPQQAGTPATVNWGQGLGQEPCVLHISGGHSSSYNWVN